QSRYAVDVAADHRHADDCHRAVSGWIGEGALGPGPHRAGAWASIRLAWAAAGNRTGCSDARRAFRRLPDRLCAGARRWRDRLCGDLVVGFDGAWAAALRHLGAAAARPRLRSGAHAGVAAAAGRGGPPRPPLDALQTRSADRANACFGRRWLMLGSFLILLAVTVPVAIYAWRKDQFIVARATMFARQEILRIFVRLPFALVAASCIAELVPEQTIAAVLGADSGLLGIAAASVLGGFMPGGPIVSLDRKSVV